jgi:WD40 repeat protein
MIQAKYLAPLALLPALALVPFEPVEAQDSKPRAVKAVMRATIKTEHSNAVSQIAVSADGRLLASASRDKSVRLWNIATGKRQAILRLPTGATAVAFSPDSKMLVYATADHKITFWEVATGKELRTLEAKHPDGGPWQMVFSPDGKTLVTWGFEDRQPKVWDVLTGTVRFKLSGPFIWSVAFSPDGGLLATATSDDVVELWDMTTGKKRKTFHGHDGRVRSVAFAPDGKTVASGGSRDRMIRFWDVATGKQGAALERQTGDTWCVAFAPDGNTLLSWSEGSPFTLWQPSSERKLTTLMSRPRVDRWALTPDLRTLAILDNGTIAVVDLARFTLAE